MRTISRFSRVALAGLVVTAAGACSSKAPDGATHGVARARQADTVSQVPLYFTRVSDLNASVRASEVDGSGNTYVGGTYGTAAYVDIFDPNGVETAHRRVRAGQAIMVSALRVNDSGYALGGTYGTDNNPAGAIQPHAYVNRYDLAGNTLFTYGGPVETNNEGIDVCDDGTTVAVVKSVSPPNGQTTLYDWDSAGVVQWFATLPGLSYASKIRCLGNGAIVVAGTVGTPSNAQEAFAFATQYESDGTLDYL
jgi:hypothetical protein